MTLSERQKITIWMFVVLTVILLGFDQENHIATPRSNVMSWYAVTLYGVTMMRDYYPADGFLHYVEGHKKLLIISSALISLALIITSKKK